MPRSKITPIQLYHNIGVGSMEIYPLSSSNHNATVVIFNGSTDKVRMLIPGNMSFSHLKRCLVDIVTVVSLKDCSKFNIVSEAKFNQRRERSRSRPIRKPSTSSADAVQKSASPKTKNASVSENLKTTSVFCYAYLPKFTAVYTDAGTR